ncbi:MAG: FAD-dependent oxidoreductase, partial [Panacibacter sp.]
MQKEKYDIIVIGAGSGGLGVSIFMAKIGLKILLIDKDDENIGGDCLNYGCVPSKALIHVSRILQQAKEAEKFGYSISGKPDMQRAIAYVHSKQDIIRKHENAAYLRKEGLDVVLGLAYFHSPDSIVVNDKIYSAKRIVLATGSRPVSLKVPGIENVTQFNNESVFDMASLPKRMLIIGGGPIGIEIGQALSRLGSKIAIIDRGAYILPHDEHAVTSILRERLQKEGIEFLMQSSIDSFPSATRAL